MTEKEWMKERFNPQAMAWVLQDMRINRTKVGKRKLRLFASACCHLFWHLLSEAILRQSVETAERFADAQASKQDLEMAYACAMEFKTGGLTLTLDNPTYLEHTAIGMARNVAQPNAFDAAFSMTTYPATISDKERAPVVCRLFREVFGNPFRRVTVNRTCLTPTVTQLAAGIYEEKAFDRMPVLSDALEDAGCTNADILNHCRQPGEHVRGCWVVDLLLDKK